MASRARTVLFIALATVSGAASAQPDVTILNEGEAASLWRPTITPLPGPGYPGIIADKSEDVCVSVGYMLNVDGTTSDFAVLGAWGSKTDKTKPTDSHFTAYSQNALAAVQRWRFQSTAGASAKLKPVYTSATFGFSTVGTDAEALKSRCRVTDLRDFITKAQGEASKKGVNRGRMDRMRAQNPDTINARPGSNINP